MSNEMKELSEELNSSVAVAHEFMSSLAPAFVDLVNTVIGESDSSQLEEKLKTIYSELSSFLSVAREYQTKLTRYSNCSSNFVEIIKGFEKAMLHLESTAAQRKVTLTNT